MKQPDSKSFWETIKFKYKLSFLNENTLEEVFSFRVSWWSGFWMLSAFALFMIALTSFVIINTPIRNYLPGYMATEIREEMITNALRADSLENAMRMQSQYIDNISQIIQGISPVAKVQVPDTLKKPFKKEDLQKSEKTEQFIKEYEQTKDSSSNMSEQLSKFIKAYKDSTPEGQP